MRYSQLTDGYAALRYLTTKPFVRASHVAVMGFSQGGWSVLASLEKGVIEQRYPAGDRSLIELFIYPGAHHGFDLVDLSLAPTRGVTAYGHRVEYNEEATKNAIARVRDFLQRTIGVQ